MELGNMIVDESGMPEIHMEQILLNAVYQYVSRLEQPKKPSQFILTPHDFDLLYKQASRYTPIPMTGKDTYYWHDILISADPTLADGTLRLMI